MTGVDKDRWDSTPLVALNVCVLSHYDTYQFGNQIDNKCFLLPSVRIPQHVEETVYTLYLRIKLISRNSNI